MSRINGCLIAVAVWLAMVGYSLAQKPKAPAPPPPEEAPVVAVEIAEAPVVAVEIDEIEAVVYGNRKPDVAHQSLRDALRRDIERFDERYALTRKQRHKLELAGRRDLKRFFDRVEMLKARKKQTGFDANTYWPTAWELHQIQRRPNTELFGEKSMLAKTLHHILTPEQVAQYEKKTYRTRVEWAVGILHSRLVLETDQRKNLVDLIVEDTAPLKRYGDFDYDAIMYQLSGIPPKTLRSVLNDDQCRALDLRFKQARRMKGVLVSEGYVEAREASATDSSRHEEARR